MGAACNCANSSPRCAGAQVVGSAEIDITGVDHDSRKAAPGSLFVCIRGFQQDGHAFIADAVARGAVAVVVEDDPARLRVPAGVTVIRVPNSRSALAHLAARFFGHPSRQLRLVGVTGHQREDHHGAPRGIHPARRGASRRPAGDHRVSLRGGHVPRRADHAGGQRPAAPPGAHARHRRLGRGDGSLVPLLDAAPGGGVRIRRRRLHQSHAGPPRLSRHHGAIRRGQGATLPGPGPRPDEAGGSGCRPERRRSVGRLHGRADGGAGRPVRAHALRPTSAPAKHSSTWRASGPPWSLPGARSTWSRRWSGGTTWRTSSARRGRACISESPARWWRRGSRTWPPCLAVSKRSRRASRSASWWTTRTRPMPWSGS